MCHTAKKELKTLSDEMCTRKVLGFFLPVVDIGFNQGLPREAEVLLWLINPSTASGGPKDQSARTITSFSLTWRESQEHKASERKTSEHVSYRE